MSIDKLYSIVQVAEILGLSYRTIYNWIDTGKLKGRKIGNSWRIAEGDVRALIDKGLDVSAEEKGGDK